MENRANPAYDPIALVQRLREVLPAIVPEYRQGRDRIRNLVVRELGTSETAADAILSDLSERGLLVYNDEGRAPGVPGHWELRAPTAT